MIYTNIKPEKEYSGFSRSTQVWEKSDGYKKLEEDIKVNGIQFPIVAFFNNGDWLETKCGEQRISIALDLNINTIPAVMYSIYYKTGFEGIPITCINDLIKICGESIENEPTYQSVSGAIKNIKFRNNYPPNPLRI